jgi:hypothetical protein
METKRPAIQAEQVEDDVAPVAAEYVPAKGIHEGKKARTRAWGREHVSQYSASSTSSTREKGVPQGKT